jgi:hypothetical protein
MLHWKVKIASLAALLCALAGLAGYCDGTFW